MKTVKLLIAVVVVSVSFSGFAQDDLLDDQTVSFKSANYQQALAKTASNLKAVFANYKIKLSKGFSITRSLVVGGTTSAPTLEAGIRKCVLVVCQDVDLDATLTIRQVSGSCDVNYELKADLQRSSHTLTENYDYFYTTICGTKTADGGSLRLVSRARRARTYNGGPVSSTIRDFLRLQIDPITQSLQAQLAVNAR